MHFPSDQRPETSIENRASTSTGSPRNPQPATRNPQPATRNSQPATRNPQLVTRNPQLATRNRDRSPATNSEHIFRRTLFKDAFGHHVDKA